MAKLGETVAVRAWVGVGIWRVLQGKVLRAGGSMLQGQGEQGKPLTSGATQSTEVLKNWGTVAGSQGSALRTMSMSTLEPTLAPMNRRICTCGQWGSST